MEYTSISESLVAAAESKNPAHARLASFILTNPNIAISSTVTELAEAARVSYATVCRFTRALGFFSFGELRRAISAMAISEPHVPDSDAPLQKNDESVITDVCNLSRSVIDNCSKAITMEQLRQLISLFCKADNIYIAGLGTSAVTARYAYIKLFRLKLPCSYDSDVILMKMKAALLNKHDVLFLISSSGRTKSIVEIAKTARRNGVMVIALSDYKTSPLSHNADITITTTSRDSSYNKYVDLPLVQGQITIIDIIYTALYYYIGDSGFLKTKESVRDEKTL